MKHHVFFSAVLLAMLAACANRPESISASHVSFEKYMDGDCEGLATQMGGARATLAKHSEAQNSKANGDAWGGVFAGHTVQQAVRRP